jgi:hypothetical protein
MYAENNDFLDRPAADINFLFVLSAIPVKKTENPLDKGLNS